MNQTTLIEQFSRLAEAYFAGTADSLQESELKALAGKIDCTDCNLDAQTRADIELIKALESAPRAEAKEKFASFLDTLTGTEVAQAAEAGAPAAPRHRKAPRLLIAILSAAAVLALVVTVSLRVAGPGKMQPTPAPLAKVSTPTRPAYQAPQTEQEPAIQAVTAASATTASESTPAATRLKAQAKSRSKATTEQQPAATHRFEDEPQEVAIELTDPEDVARIIQETNDALAKSKASSSEAVLLAKAEIKNFNNRINAILK